MASEKSKIVAFKGIRSGSEVELKIAKSATILWLNDNSLSSIDLDDISEFNNIERIYLENNFLYNVDLSPLKNSSSLKWINISNNELQKIDLQPLASCKSLAILELASNKLDDLDLSPLSECMGLSTLVLSDNNLRDIDLSPLRRCTNLQHIHLSGNNLEGVDLEPLRGCKGLQNLFLDRNQIGYLNLSHIESANLIQLNLSRNKIAEIDLSPLKSGGYLAVIDLSHNNIKKLDLSPLSDNSHIWKLSLIGNPLPYLDLSPVAQSWSGSSWSRSKVVIQPHDATYYQNEDERGNILLQVEANTILVIDPFLKEILTSNERYGFSQVMDRISWILGPDLAEKIYNDDGWQGVKKRLEMLPKNIALSALSMTELAGLEKPLEDVTNAIEENMSFSEGLYTAYMKAVELLEKQLERNDSTHELDVARMKETVAARLIPKILELRKQELNRIELKRDSEGYISLEELKGTYYGRLILDKLGIGWRMKSEDLEVLKSTFRELGLEIKGS
ncbi:MAG: leucine-rich repeat protein [Candidatus Thorarchaeota archaeon]|nr:leucine-rich repeat protein [Candidatus Thorarchaeota archaeon]